MQTLRTYLSKAFFSSVQSFWNFAYIQTIISPCLVQNFEMTEQIEIDVMDKWDAMKFWLICIFWADLLCCNDPKGKQCSSFY